MPDYPLALITGSAQRLGKAFALSLAKCGYAIFLHYQSSEVEASRTASEICALGVPVVTYHADLTSEAEIETMFKAVDEMLMATAQVSRFTVLVNSAAIMPSGDARTMPVSEFDSAIALNLRAPFILSQQAYRRMSEGSLIVNISDIGAQKVWSGYPAYTVSKAGLEALTRVLARSFAPKVRVNAIAPGLALPSDEFPFEEWSRLASKIPLKRPANLEELTSTLEFLISNQYITGETIAVDGGYLLI